jgi:hypothetical protein
MGFWLMTGSVCSGWPIDSQIFSSRQQTANRRSGISQPAASRAHRQTAIQGHSYHGLLSPVMSQLRQDKL